MKRTRKNYSPEFKAKVVLKATSRKQNHKRNGKQIRHSS